MEVQFQPLKNLFILYCALNANGYDKENAKEMHSVRLSVRKYLAGKTFPKFDFKWNAYQYAKHVLLSENLSPKEHNNSDFYDALIYLQQFNREANLDEIWPSVEDTTNKVLADYKKVVSPALDGLRRMLDMEEPSGQIVITVNLLESYFRGFSIQVGDITYLITGPSEKPNLRNIMHELLHAYLKKAKFQATVNPDLYATVPVEMKTNYPLEMIAEESMVRALVIYIGRELKVDKIELSEQDQKLILPKLYLTQLEKFSRITSDILEEVATKVLKERTVWD